MSIYFTSHFKIRVFERKIAKDLEEKILNGWIVPYRLVRKLELVDTPLREMKREHYLYIFYPPNEFYVLIREGSTIIAKTFFQIEDIRGEVLSNLVNDSKLQKVKDIPSK
jgi:hypothetical protein